MHGGSTKKEKPPILRREFIPETEWGREFLKRGEGVLIGNEMKANKPKKRQRASIDSFESMCAGKGNVTLRIKKRENPQKKKGGRVDPEKTAQKYHPESIGEARGKRRGNDQCLDRARRWGL